LICVLAIASDAIQQTAKRSTNLKAVFTILAKAAFKKLRVISRERLDVTTKLLVHPLPLP